MQFKYLIIPVFLIFQKALAQEGPASVTITQAAIETPPAPASSTPVVPAVSENQATIPEITAPTAILDYKSVYETATVEEEVKMAAERFGLTQAQQDLWLTAATERRFTEKQAQSRLDSNAGNITREGVYRGLRSSHTAFHETISGYLTPAQKQAIETDRQILIEKQRRLAKLPPPPPPTPTVAAIPVDSAATKEPEPPGKKSKKKKKKGT